jgi:hypothetical protein
MTDWLIAFDDGLTQVTLAYVLWVRCHTTDPEQHSLRAIMRQRYGGDLRGEPIGTCLPA